MSYRTFNIILKTDDDSHTIQKYLSAHFQYFSIREFFSPFSGYICQVNEQMKDRSFDSFPDSTFTDQEEVEDYFHFDLDEKIAKLSDIFPTKEIAFIDVDCFGGKCVSDGYIIKNQEKSLEQDPHHSGHTALLKKLYPDFHTWFFYPFTRTFFTDKGGLNGDITNYTFAGLWLSVTHEFESNKAYKMQATENELYLECSSFDIYFMKINEERIKVTGRILSDKEETYHKVKDILEDLLAGITYSISIDNFVNGTSTTLSTLDTASDLEMKSTSYRATTFNEKPLPLGLNKESKPSEENTPKTKTSERKKSWLERLFRM